MSLLPEEPSRFRPENRPLSLPVEPNPECSCSKCNPRAWWMVLCSICGNKRCPKAKDHGNDCTGSNEPGQVATQTGVDWTPPAAEPAPQEQPPRQEGETPIMDALIQRKASTFMDGGKYRQKLEQTGKELERRAADAEASNKAFCDNIEAALNLCPHTIRCCEGGGPEDINGSLALTMHSMMAKIAAGETEPDPTDTLPANARFEEVEKPHPDSLRLDWLEAQSNGWPWISRESSQGRGYRVHNTNPVFGEGSPTVREAIDAAMSAPSAKGATP